MTYFPIVNNQLQTCEHLNFFSLKMNKMLKIGFIGGGKIAQAMANGFIASG